MLCTEKHKNTELDVTYSTFLVRLNGRSLVEDSIAYLAFSFASFNCSSQDERAGRFVSARKEASDGIVLSSQPWLR